MALIEQQDALAFEIGLLDALLPGERVVLGHEQQEGLVEDRALGDGRLVHGQGEDPRIDLVRGELGQQLLRLQLAEDELQARKASSQRGQQPWQQVGRQGGDDAQRQRAGERLGSAFRDGADRAHAVQHRARRGAHLRADRRGLHLLRAALDPRDLQRRLQLLDGLRQGRLRNAAGLRGLRERGFLGQRH